MDWFGRFYLAGGSIFVGIVSQAVSALGRSN
jgi:hypothetical protein